MITDILVDANKIFGRFNFKTVAVFNKDNKCCLSGSTEDTLCYFSEMTKEDYSYKEFAFRDWANITSLVGTFLDSEHPEDFQIKVNVNDEDYPCSMEFKSGQLKYLHYLQTYTFLSKQDDLLANYKRKKFTLKAVEENGLSELTKKEVAQMSRISSVLGEKFFHLEQEDNGDLYACYGDSNVSADNARVKLQSNYPKTDFDKAELFCSQYFTESIKGLMYDDNPINISVKQNMIVISTENDIGIKVVAIKSKR